MRIKPPNHGKAVSKLGGHLPVYAKGEQKYVVDILDSYEDSAGQIAVELDKLISTRRFTGV